jgi:hypothetical protein
MSVNRNVTVPVGRSLGTPPSIADVFAQDGLAKQTSRSRFGLPAWIFGLAVRPTLKGAWHP